MQASNPVSELESARELYSRMKNDARIPIGPDGLTNKSQFYCLDHERADLGNIVARCSPENISPGQITLFHSVREHYEAVLASVPHFDGVLQTARPFREVFHELVSDVLSRTVNYEELTSYVALKNWFLADGSNGTYLPVSAAMASSRSILQSVKDGNGALGGLKDRVAEMSAYATAVELHYIMSHDAHIPRTAQEPSPTSPVTSLAYSIRSLEGARLSYSRGTMGQGSIDLVERTKERYWAIRNHNSGLSPSVREQVLAVYDETASLVGMKIYPNKEFFLKVRSFLHRNEVYLFPEILAPCSTMLNVGVMREAGSGPFTGLFGRIEELKSALAPK